MAPGLGRVYVVQPMATGSGPSRPTISGPTRRILSPDGTQGRLFVFDGTNRASRSMSSTSTPGPTALIAFDGTVDRRATAVVARWDESSSSIGTLWTEIPARWSGPSVAGRSRAIGPTRACQDRRCRRPVLAGRDRDPRVLTPTDPSWLLDPAGGPVTKLASDAYRPDLAAPRRPDLALPSSFRGRLAHVGSSAAVALDPECEAGAAVAHAILSERGHLSRATA